MTKSAITYDYYHQKSGKTIFLRSVNLPVDIECLYKWVHEPHVIPHWKLNKPKSALYQHFRKSLEDRHQSLFIVAIDTHEIGYAEIYDASHDRLANFCEVHPDDYGIHLFIGPPHALGQGYSELILAALTDYLFTRKKAKRVLVEPNQHVHQLSLLERKLGFSNLGMLRLPEKIAMLYAITSDKFYQHTPKRLKAADMSFSTEIQNDLSTWPLVRIHFPNFPSDDNVTNWLKKTNPLLSCKEPCVIICTFGEHYQFSPSARRYQALWFKKNRDRLKTACIGMIRVTQDQEMIAKMTSNSMRKGMPFICIPANSPREAEKIACRLLNKSKHSPCRNKR